MIHVMNRKGITFCALLFLVTTAALADEVVRSANTEAQLISKVTSIQPGQPVTVALRLHMDEHWHTYWQNPGDSGLATKIRWTLPVGFEAGPIQWPAPMQFELGGLMNYGYEGQIVLPVTIQTPADLKPGASVTLKAKASWLECEKECIPGKADLSLTLPVQTDPPAINAKWESLFNWATQRTPVPDNSATLTAGDDGKLLLRIADVPDAAPVYFYVSDAQTLSHTAEQKLSLDEDGALLELSVSDYAQGPVTQLRGVLQVGNTYRKIDTSVASAATTSAETASAAPTVKQTISLWQSLLFAFLGGAILNLMPCVFPVLSIKILGFVNQAGQNRAKILKHGLIFGLGVVISFWILAGVLMALRAGGAQLGWGFQLQEPRFVVALAILMFIVGLNFAGVFEVGIGLMNIAGKAQAKTESGYAGSFFSGVLAVVVATPCTAPFMGPAIGAALTLPTFSMAAIFTALGVGMALPYVILSAFPGWLDLLPRPGAWMETFKQVMAFAMFGATIWLVWLFGQQVGGANGMLFMLLGLLVVGIAGWIFGRWQSAPSRVIAVVILAIGIAVPIWSINRLTSDSNLEWLVFSDATVEQLRSEGQIVFIDFTADWCLTCKFNENTVLSSKRVLDAFSEHDVALLKADWTRQDPHITAALERFGRAGVPLYVFYPSDKSAEPIVLPTVITADMVIDAIKKSASPLTLAR